jgi:hypothetical protein
MLENWCWTSVALKRLSCHKDTNETLPDDLLEAMIKAKNVGVGLQMARQIYLGQLDLAIHGDDVPADASGLQALVDEMRPRITLLKNPEGANMLRNFGHLMNQCVRAKRAQMVSEAVLKTTCGRSGLQGGAGGGASEASANGPASWARPRETRNWFLGSLVGRKRGCRGRPPEPAPAVHALGCTAPPPLTVPLCSFLLAGTRLPTTGTCGRRC